MNNGWIWARGTMSVVHIRVLYISSTQHFTFVSETAKHSAITTVLQLCVFPRCCFTSVDAIFCAKFLYIMHSLKTTNFSSLICFDRVLSSVVSIGY